MSDQEEQHERDENEVWNQVTTDVLNFIPGIGFALDLADFASGSYDYAFGDTERERSDGATQMELGFAGMMPGGILLDAAQLGHDIGRANHFDETGEKTLSFEEQRAEDAWNREHPPKMVPANELPQEEEPTCEPSHNVPERRCEQPPPEPTCDLPAEEPMCELPPDEQFKNMLFYGMFD